MIDIDHVRVLLDEFEAGSQPSDIESLTMTRELLVGKSNPFCRSDYDPGHITSSAIVVSPDLEAVILVNHDRVGRWIQPGGHIEPTDESLEGAACREVTEETGVSLKPDERTKLVRVDVHQIPKFKNEPPHRHHDLTFSFRAEHRDHVTVGDSTWMWCAIDKLATHMVESQLVASVRRAVAIYSL